VLDSDTPAPVAGVARALSWLIIALMIVAIAYASWIVIQNWNAISV
jgi:hypothetical protein